MQRSFRRFTITSLLATAFAIGAAASAQAAVVLTFEGLQDNEQVFLFYEGGFGSMGSIGPNFGVDFFFGGAGAIARIDRDAGGTGNFANEPSPSTTMRLASTENIMNVFGGFTTGFSFFYSSSEIGTVEVYEDAFGTGTLLASIPVLVNIDLANLDNNNCTGDPTGVFCNWDPVGAAFDGVARSVVFNVAVGFTGFDDITLGSVTPGQQQAVSEPGIVGLLGLGLAGLRLRRRRPAAGSKATLSLP